MNDKPYVDTAPLEREVWTPTASHDVAPYQAAIARIAELEQQIANVRAIINGATTSPYCTISEHLLAQRVAEAIT